MYTFLLTICPHSPECEYVYNFHCERTLVYEEKFGAFCDWCCKFIGLFVTFRRGREFALTIYGPWEMLTSETYSIKPSLLHARCSSESTCSTALIHSYPISARNVH